MLWGGKPKPMLGGFMPGMADMTPQAMPQPAMANPMAAMSGQMAQTSQALAPKKPGINWLGVIADALAGAAGREGPYAAQMQRKREQEFAAQQGQQERMNKRDDWQWQKQWELDHPAPINNDTINDFNWYKSLSAQDRAIYDQQHPVIVQGPDGPYVVPRNAISGASAPIGGGVHPSDWDNATPMGGPSQPATGRFPG